MIINETSVLKDIKQALYGDWNITTDDGWKCCELGHFRIYKKICEAGSTVLPKTFLNNRTEVCPMLEFRKDSISGQTINLQQTALKLTENALCVILEF